MTWEGPSVMEKKMGFILEWLEGTTSMSDLCAGYGISRPTGYELIQRYAEEGVAGFEPKSRAPHQQPHAVSQEIRDQIVRLRQQYTQMGPKKLRVLLQTRMPETKWPSASTIGEILKRAGLVVSRKRKARACPSANTVPRAESNNQIWCIDFKGKIAAQEGSVCYPLTVMDEHSRFLLACQGLRKGNGDSVRAVLDRLFRDYGMPIGIRSDNDPPFASVGIGGLSRLALWWIKLGIQPIRIQPARPDQNGCQERMHRTLNEWVKHHPIRCAGHFTKAFAAFREEYNWIQPHEALGQIPPGQGYQSSRCPYPGHVPTVEYPGSMKVRRVKQHGEFSWRSQHWYVGETLAGEPIGLDLQDDSNVDVYFAQYRIGSFNPERVDKRRVISALTLQTMEEWEDQKTH